MTPLGWLGRKTSTQTKLHCFWSPKYSSTAFIASGPPSTHQQPSLLLVPQVLINSLHCFWSPKYSSTTFIASKIPTRNVSFQIWKHTEVRRGYLWRILGMRKDLEAAFNRSSHSNFRKVWAGTLHYLARAEHLQSHFLFFSSQYPDAAALVLLHSIHHLSWDLPQDNLPW